MRRKIWVAASLLASILSQGVFASPPTTRAAVSLTVSVFNDAGVPQAVLHSAQARAEGVFIEAGISLAWLDCGTPGHRAANLGCNAMAFPTHFSVRLITSSMQIPEDTFGQSFLDGRGEGNYADVYVAPLASSKALDVVNKGDLLGYVVAHEIGHLLLGPDSHSQGGLMRSVWQFAELRQAARGNLFFTGYETERMRSRYLAASTRLSIRAINPAASGM